MGTSTIEIPTALKNSLIALSKINNDLKDYAAQKNCEHMKEAFDDCRNDLGSAALNITNMIQSECLDYYHKDKIK